MNVVASTHKTKMPLYVCSEKVKQPAEKLATRMHISKTEAVRLALESELRRLDEALPLRKLLQPPQRCLLARPRDRSRGRQSVL